MSTHSIVEHRGLAQRNSDALRYTEPIRARRVSDRTVRRLVAELRAYAASDAAYGAFRDHLDERGRRTVTATRYVRGVENVRRLEVIR